VAAKATANQRKVLDLAKAGRNWETIPHQADQSGMKFFKNLVDIVAYKCYPYEHQPHHHGNHNIKTRNTRGWLTGRQVLISPYALVAAIKAEQHIAIDLTKKQIEGSPSLNLVLNRLCLVLLRPRQRK